jgi:signal transduction histidine kinase
MLVVLEGFREKISSATASQRLEWKRLMGVYYEHNGHPDSALAYMKQYFTLSDSIANAQKLLTAADVARQLGEKEQQLQITGLRKEREVALTSLFVTLILCAMALLIIYLVYHNYRRHKKNLLVQQALNTEIQNQKAAREEEARLQHKKITEAVIYAQEQERSVIGLELHDNINQVLTTVKLYNEMVLSGMVEPKFILPRSISHLQTCISEIRGLSRRLSAPTLGKISLSDSILDLVNSINETNKVKISCSISGLTDDVLKKELHLGIYRILQEQLHNVLKHSEASEVTIQVEQQPGAIRLQVSDNGIGFVVNKSNCGIGLMNMQTRAENLNGTFELESHPGKGCKIEVLLPCVQEC